MTQWKLVPAEPTPEMIEAYNRVPCGIGGSPPHGHWVWSAMVRAAPTVAPAEPSLSAINDLAKTYANSYASPHHITFTVEGLRSLIAAAGAIAQGIEQPALAQLAPISDDLRDQLETLLDIWDDAKSSPPGEGTYVPGALGMQFEEARALLAEAVHPSPAPQEQPALNREQRLAQLNREIAEHLKEDESAQPAGDVAAPDLSVSKEWLKEKLAVTDDTHAAAGVAPRPCDSPPGCNASNCLGCGDDAAPPGVKEGGNV